MTVPDCDQGLYRRCVMTLPSFTFTQSVQSLDQLSCQENMRYNSAEILFQSFLLKVLVSSSGLGRGVHSLMLSIKHFFCRPRRRLLSKVPWRMILERLSWRVAYPETCKFPSLDTCQKRFLWTHEEVDLVLRPVVCLVLKVEDTEMFQYALGFQSWILFYRVSKQLRVSQP